MSTITENDDTFEICDTCTDWVGTCICPTDTPEETARKLSVWADRYGRITR
jgi:hypothetical protein